MFGALVQAEASCTLERRQAPGNTQQSRQVTGCGTTEGGNHYLHHTSHDARCILLKRRHEASHPLLAVNTFYGFMIEILPDRRNEWLLEIGGGG